MVCLGKHQNFRLLKGITHELDILLLFFIRGFIRHLFHLNFKFYFIGNLFIKEFIY